MDELKWLVIKTNPRAEKLVAQRLSEIGIINYLPIRRELKQWKDRKKWVDEVLIKSYVFVQTTERLKNNVFEVFGVIRFLYVSKKLAVVTDNEIEILNILCKLNDVKIEPKGFEIGEKVEIIEGVLIGMQGILKESQKGNKISIFIEALGMFANISIKISEVRKL
jgi:transcriptional antiterminator RfaH